MQLLEVMEEDVEIDLVDRAALHEAHVAVGKEFKAKMLEAALANSTPAQRAEAEAAGMSVTVYVPEELQRELNWEMTVANRRVAGMDSTGRDLPGQGARKVRLKWEDVADRFGIPTTNNDGWREQALEALVAADQLPKRRGKVALAGGE